MENTRIDDTRLFKEFDASFIFKGLGKKVLNALGPFGYVLDLSANDWMSIRDLLDFAQCPNDPALAVVIMALFSTLEEGSLCLDLDSGRFIDRFPASLQDMADGYRKDFGENLSQGKYRGIIDENTGKYLPLVVDNRHGNTLLYFQKFHVHESRLKGLVQGFLSSERSPAGTSEEIDVIIESLYSPSLAIRVGKHLEPIEKDPIQMKAVRLSLGSRFSIISGGPGTGKTSLMVTILRAFIRCGIEPSEIILGAPTGRAAQRMTEAVRNNLASVENPTPEDLVLRELKGATLHKILKYNGHRHDFHYNASNPLRAKVVVLDEVSMVDLVMLETFLHAVESSNTRLILLGDKDQLPSVDAGSVFAEMIPDGTKAEKFKDRLVVLENVYRSGTHLLDLVRTINRGQTPDMNPVSMDDALALSSDQWAFVLSDPLESIQASLKSWADYYYLKPNDLWNGTYSQWVRTASATRNLCGSDEGKDILKHMFDVVDHARILTLIRKGTHGCNGINAFMGHYLCTELDPFAPSGGRFFSGQLIIVTRNDYAKDLFNGDVGVILNDAEGLYKAYFKRSDTVVGIPVDQLPVWEPAFAMTVHKSQGSEFDDVFLVLPDDPDHRLLTREIVYTGMTRAKSRVTVYGSPQAMTRAISRTIERQSGLQW
ncbi:MAG: exodeoxyribonuclease V subunit alpha [Proteobacteria bacterium]|nr:exodeoxyribonuclease V subunit alpha [Pseudomonadota bacterium]